MPRRCWPIRGSISVAAAIVATFSPQIAIDHYHDWHDFVQAIFAVPVGVVFGITALRGQTRLDRRMGIAGLVVCGTLLLNMLVSAL